MTTIAQIQRAMGPVYAAWANIAQDYHYTQAESVPVKQIKPPEKCLSDKRVDDAIALLSIRPMTGSEIKKVLCCTTRQWAMVFERMPKDSIKHEQIGTGKYRYVLYWVDSMPPKLTERSTSHQVLEFFGRKKWTEINKIPAHICKDGRDRQKFVAHLISRGKLTQRISNGVRQIGVNKPA